MVCHNPCHEDCMYHAGYLFSSGGCMNSTLCGCPNRDSVTWDSRLTSGASRPEPQLP